MNSGYYLLGREFVKHGELFSMVRRMFLDEVMHQDRSNNLVGVEVRDVDKQTKTRLKHGNLYVVPVSAIINYLVNRIFNDANNSYVLVKVLFEDLVRCFEEVGSNTTSKVLLMLKNRNLLESVSGKNYEGFFERYTSTQEETSLFLRYMTFIIDRVLVESLEQGVVMTMSYFNGFNTRKDINEVSKSNNGGLDLTLCECAFVLKSVIQGGFSGSDENTENISSNDIEFGLESVNVAVDKTDIEEVEKKPKSNVLSLVGGVKSKNNKSKSPDLDLPPIA